MRKGDILELKIEKNLFPSKGIAFIDDRKIEIPNTYKGEKILAKIMKKRKVIQARLIKRLTPFNEKVECSNFDRCGGCSSLHIDINRQREIKKEEVRSLFLSHGIDLPEFDIEGSQESFYRNKAEFTFGDPYKDGPLNLGFHERFMGKNILDIDSCVIIDKDMQIIRDYTIDYFKDKDISYYHIFKREGVLRSLVIRVGVNTDEIMVNLVATKDILLEDESILEDYLAGLKAIKLKKKIVSVLLTINNSLSSVVYCDKLIVLYGRDYIREELLGITFKISPFSFFQTNTKGAERLFSYLRSLFKEKDITLWDIYCGTGVISILLSDYVKEAIGVEIVEEAVLKARENAKELSKNNLRYICADTKDALKIIGERPDCIIVDPPRPGIHPKALKELINISSKRFIYISCNPKTLAIDLETLLLSGYKIESFKLFDFYPNTPHVECVVLLSLKT